MSNNEILLEVRELQEKHEGLKQYMIDKRDESLSILEEIKKLEAKRKGIENDIDKKWAEMVETEKQFNKANSLLVNRLKTKI